MKHFSALIGILQWGEMRASLLCGAARRCLSGFLSMVQYGEMDHCWQSSEETCSWVCLLGFRWIFTLHQLGRKCCAFKSNPFASVISQTAQGKHGELGEGVGNLFQMPRLIFFLCVFLVQIFGFPFEILSMDVVGTISEYRSALIEYFHSWQGRVFRMLHGPATKDKTNLHFS